MLVPVTRDDGCGQRENLFLVDDLTRDQRRILELIVEPFDARAEWTTQDAIQRRLYRHGERKLDAAQVIGSMPPGLVRTDGTVGGKVSLTLSGLKALHRGAELYDFMTFLRLALELYGKDDEAKVGAYDLVQGRGFNDLRLRKLGLLLEQEFFLTSGATSSSGGTPFEWTINRDIWRYDGAHTIEQYLEERNRQLSTLRTSATSPLGAPPYYLPGEVPSPGSDPERSTSTTDGAAFVQDQVLRERCEKLLAANSHFDTVIREAAVVLEDRVREAIGGSDATGVPLMEHAFSQKAPRLRLSTDPQEQLGAMQLYRGTMAFFRNPVGHQLKHTYTREDAVRFVAMVDLLLALLAKAKRT